jgi:hypothetical protein
MTVKWNGEEARRLIRRQYVKNLNAVAIALKNRAKESR